MKYFIPTYNECREICDAHDNFLFFEQKYVINGYNVSIFDYKLAYADVFINPVGGKDYSAHELRGLTFIFNHDGSLYKQYILLAKFFNINQCVTTEYDAIKHYKIEVVQEKMDGSVVSFVKFPNGDVLGKSKASFISDMAVAATDIYNNDPLIKKFVDDMFENDITPIFEYISPYNRVVIKYSVEELILLQLRDNKTGEYLSLNSVLEGVKCAPVCDITLDELIGSSKTLEGIEGYVVRFDNGVLVKNKTKWYFERHNLFTETLSRENDIIALVLNDTIDDVLANVGEVAKTVNVELIQKKLNKYISSKVSSTEDLLLDFDGDIKEFSLKNEKHVDFGFAMGVINGRGDLVGQIKKTIIKKTYFLMNAKDFLSKINL
jgi:T4 RnlA family RNA ligase